MAEEYGVEQPTFALFTEKAEKFCKDFKGVGRGKFATKALTPYFHLLAAHYARIMEVHGSLKQYSCQRMCKARTCCYCQRSHFFMGRRCAYTCVAKGWDCYIDCK